MFGIRKKKLESLTPEEAYNQGNAQKRENTRFPIISTQPNVGTPRQCVVLPTTTNTAKI